MMSNYDHAATSRPPQLQPSIPAPAMGSSSGLTAMSPTALSPSSDSNGPLSRIYVIPPRPKPGRKPATDTPQTKRKEQNREAQRAFRERRAARVGELEDELTDKYKVWQEREAVLEKTLQDQQRSFKTQLDTLQGQKRELEYALDNERRVRMRLEDENQALRRQTSRYSASSITSYGSGVSTPLSRRAVSPVAHDKLSHRVSRSLPTSRSDVGRQPRNTDAFDPSCNRCANGGTCECLEQKLANVTHATSPGAGVEPMEIDFTTTRPTKQNSGAQQSSSMEYAPHDSISTSEPCGFCTDNQNCVCNSYREPPKPIKLPSISAPGSCDKCQADPERANFCRMLAQAPPLGPPQASSSSSAAHASGRRLPSISEKIAMSCDEAYDTLSKEPAFKDRRNSLSFINQFRARPADASRSSTDNQLDLAHQSALEVDIAGVLASMRAERHEEMDRRR